MGDIIDNYIWNAMKRRKENKMMNNVKDLLKKKIPVCSKTLPLKRDKYEQHRNLF